jgi:hypothetical protein
VRWRRGLLEPRKALLMLGWLRGRMPQGREQGTGRTRLLELNDEAVQLPSEPRPFCELVLRARPVELALRLERRLLELPVGRKRRPLGRRLVEGESLGRAPVGGRQSSAPLPKMRSERERDGTMSGRSVLPSRSTNSVARTTSSSSRASSISARKDDGGGGGVYARVEMGEAHRPTPTSSPSPPARQDARAQTARDQQGLWGRAHKVLVRGRSASNHPAAHLHPPFISHLD